MTKARQINMTEGPIFGKLLYFVIPLMITNILQVLYNAADMIIVSLSSEPDAVGAIGTTAPMINLFVNIFIGFSVGANVVTARYIGAGHPERVRGAVHTAIPVGLILGTAGGGVGIACERPILLAMGYSGRLLELASKYVIIYFCGTPFLSLTNYAVAILRAEGNTKTPLYVMSGTGLLNVALNLLFVLCFGMSVDGVALATTISNAASSSILLIYLARDKGLCRFSLKYLKFDRKALKNIIYIGLPAGIQGALFSVSNMLIQSSVIKVNNMVTPAGISYQPVVKGNAATANLESFAYTATNSVYQASVTFTGQNVGAGKYKRIGSVMRSCYLVTFCVAVISAGLILLLRQPLLSLYGVVPGAEGSGEAIAYSTAVTRMLYMYPLYFLLAFMEVGSGILRGLGKSMTSTTVSLIGSCVFRIVWIFTAFAAHPTLGIIYVSYPISWGLTALIHFICCTAVRKKLLRRQNEKKNSADLSPQ
ncbi:MAG: MATE family efflux transporter [Acutalibacteraceae bacterium]